jgi:ATP-dependent Clp protease ATP-binding subunit ClpA
MGRCARAAWDYAVESFQSGPTRRPGITTANILLGVLKHDTCAGGLILGKMGLDLNLAYKHAAFVLQYGRRQEQPDEPVMWGGLPHTSRAKDVLDLCVDEANLFSPTYSIGTEHLTLALLRVPDGTGGRILRWFGITEDAVRRTRDELWEILRLFEPL